jgi:hypothetical protein
MLDLVRGQPQDMHGLLQVGRHLRLEQVYDLVLGD